MKLMLYVIIRVHVVTFQIQRFRDSKKNTTEEENEIKEVSNEYTHA